MLQNLKICYVHRYESYYAVPLGRKKNAQLSDQEKSAFSGKRSKTNEKKYTERQKEAKVEQAIQDQFLTGKYVVLSGLTGTSVAQGLLTS